MASGVRGRALTGRSGQDFQGWADGVHKVAQDVVYNGIREGEKPSQGYLDTGIRTVKRQMALAGYRLASLLDQALANAAPLSAHPRRDAAVPPLRGHAGDV
eukprot:tig00000367_g24477.t1